MLSNIGEVLPRYLYDNSNILNWLETIQIAKVQTLRNHAWCIYIVLLAFNPNNFVLLSVQEYMSSIPSNSW